MKHSHLRFKIAQLRQDKQLMMIESIAVFVFALFVAILLPSLLIRYVYADQQLFEQPKVIEYIPVASFAVGTVFFLYAILTNLSRLKQIKALERELEATGCDCHGNCMCGPDGDMSLVDKTAKKATVKKTASRKSSSKSKRSSKKA